MAVEDEFYDPAELTTSASASNGERPDVSEYAELAADLRERVSGEIQFDE